MKTFKSCVLAARRKVGCALRVSLAGCSLMFASASMAGDAGVVYTQLSTNGIGIGYARSITNDIALRGQINNYNGSFSGDVGDFGAGLMDVQLKMSTYMAIGDWYPTEDSSLRLSAGLVLNDNKVVASTTNATINGKPGVAAVAEIRMSKQPTPYIGIGYSTRPKDAKGLGFNVDLGVMLQQPVVTLRVSGGGVTQADADAQLAKVRDAANKLKVMPVVGVGLNYAY